MNGQYSVTVINQFHEFSWILPSGEEAALRDHCHGWHDGSWGVLKRCNGVTIRAWAAKLTGRHYEKIWCTWSSSSMMMMMMRMKKMKKMKTHIIQWRILWNHGAEWFQAANVCFVVIADISKAFWDAHLAAMLARACDADSSILVLHHHSDPSWRRSTFQPPLVIFFPGFSLSPSSLWDLISSQITSMETRSWPGWVEVYTV